MTRFLRPNVLAMAGYTPGEQPRLDGLIKLNTNENPYPPSPRVAAAIEEFLRAGRLRKYPDPSGKHFRDTAGQLLGVDPEGILIGNGSDDLLTILTRAFVPEGGLVVSPSPSYLLYQSLADIQGRSLSNSAFHPGLGSAQTLACKRCPSHARRQSQFADRYRGGRIRSR